MSLTFFAKIIYRPGIFSQKIYTVSMSEIFLIRHAQSESNVGKTDDDYDTIHLTENGREQAEKLANNFIARFGAPDHIITSTYSRTAETAAPMINLALKASNYKTEQFIDFSKLGKNGDNYNDNIWPSLREFTYLQPSNIINSTIHDCIVKTQDFWNHARENTTFRDTPTENNIDNADVESLLEFAKRTDFALESIAKKFSATEEKIAIFSHGCTIAAMLDLIENSRDMDSTMRKMAENRRHAARPIPRNVQVAQVALANGKFTILDENVFRKTK